MLAERMRKSRCGHAPGALLAVVLALLGSFVPPHHHPQVLSQPEWVSPSDQGAKGTPGQECLFCRAGKGSAQASAAAVLSDPRRVVSLPSFDPPDAAPRSLFERAAHSRAPPVSSLLQG